MADYRYTRHAKQTGAETETNARDEGAGAVGPVEPAAGVAVLRSEAPDAADPLGGTTAPEDVTKALRRRRGAGKPLPAKDADQFGESYGADLSGVRLHTDGEADVLARSVGAAAFTYGSDVYFAAGNYSEGGEGKRLLAHELAHVAQQGTGPSASAGSAPVIGRAADSHEHDADRMADGALSEMRRSAANSTATEEPTVQRMTVAELVKLHESFITKAAGNSKLDAVLEQQAEAKGGDAKVEEAKGEEAKVEQAKVEEATAEEAPAEDGKAEEAKVDEAKVEGGNTEEAKTEDAKVEEAKTEEAKTEGGNTEEAKTEGGNTEEPKTDEAKTEGGNTEEPKVEEAKTEEEANLDTAEIDGKTEAKVEDAAADVEAMEAAAADELEKAKLDDTKTVPSAKVGSLSDLYMKYGKFLAASQILAGSRNRSSSEQHKLRSNVLAMLAGDRWLKSMKKMRYADFVTFVGTRRDSLLQQAEELLEKLTEDLKNAEDSGDALDDTTSDEEDAAGEEGKQGDEPTQEEIDKALLDEAKKTVGVDGGLLLDGTAPINTAEDEAPVNGDGWKRFVVGEGNDLHLIPAADEEIKVDKVVDGEIKIAGEINIDDGIIKGMSGDGATTKIEDVVEFLRSLKEKGMSLDFQVKGLAGAQEKKALQIVESNGAQAGGTGSPTDADVAAVAAPNV